MTRAATRFLVMTAGYVFLFIGLIGMLTPIPFGVVFLVLALLLLIPTSERTVDIVRRLRMRFERIDRFMDSVSLRVPSPYRRILQRTRIDILDSRRS